MTAKNRTLIRITVSAGVGCLILLFQGGRVFVRRFGPHPVNAARGVGADAAALFDVVRQSVRWEDVSQQNADVLVETLVAGAAAASEYKRGQSH